MAKQEGVMLFTGSIGNLSFYKSNGNYYVRKKSGVSRERIMTDPAYARTRENIAEFSHASQATKLIRQAFASLFQSAGDKYVSSRLTGTASKVVKSDPVNTRGKRNIMNGDGTLFHNFDLNKSRKLSSIFLPQITPSIDRTTGMMSVSILPFSPLKMLSVPEGATHFRLVAAGAAIDFNAGTYSVRTSETIDLPLNIKTKGPLQLRLTVPVSARPMFLLFGIEFLQSVNGKQHPLKSGNAIKIVKVDGFGPCKEKSSKDKLRMPGTFSRAPLQRRVQVRRTFGSRAPTRRKCEPLNHQLNNVLPRILLPNVISSAYSRSPPTGTPRAMTLTLSGRSLIRLLI